MTNNISYKIEENFRTNLTTITDTGPKSDILYETVVYALTIPLFVLTAAGNGVILITIKFQARLLSSTSNYFILSLSLADFFVGVAIMPIMIVYTAHKQTWNYSQILCDSWMSFDFLCSSASFLTLSTMSIERYKMLTTSYVHIKHSSKLRILIFVCLSWLLPFFSWIPILIVFRIRNGPSKQYDCSLPGNRYLILFLCIFLYHIPLICMVTFYTKLIIHIRKSSMANLELCDNINFTNALYNQYTNVLSSRNQKRYSQIMCQQNRNNIPLINKIERNNSCISEHIIHDNNQKIRRYSINILTDSVKSNTKANNTNKSSPVLNNRLNNNNTKENFYMFYTRGSSYDAQSSTLFKKLNKMLCCCIKNVKNDRRSSIIKNKINKKTRYNQHQNSRFLPENSSVPSCELVKNMKKYQINNRCANSSNKLNLNLVVVNNQNGNSESFYRTSRDNSINSQVENECLENESCILMRQQDSSYMNSQNMDFTVGNVRFQKCQSKSSLFRKKSFVKLNEDVQIGTNLNPNDLLINTNNKDKRLSMITSLSKKKDSIGFMENTDYQNLRLKRNRKAARMLGLLVAAFCVCWLPYTIVYPLSQFYEEPLLPNWLNIIIWWLGYLNSTINPFLYVYSNKNIRRSVRILFFKRFINFITGNKVNKNFRSDSLKNNQAVPRNDGGIIGQKNRNNQLVSEKPVSRQMRLKNNL